ncbi:hypothetical protein [Guptibacillus spartinae]|uniref:hypothetical protein n=1 Tax=Guptibacillus spartinae TaxID=3025679 RepID=UPI00235EF545|nr:hypothetical protein [Pseudalkalibacillus spartinae]
MRTSNFITGNLLNFTERSSLGISIGSIGNLISSAATFLSICLILFFITIVVYRNIKKKNFQHEINSLLTSNQKNISTLLSSMETIKNRGGEGFENKISEALLLMEGLLEESRLNEVEISNIKLPIFNHHTVFILISEYRKKIKNCKLDIPSVEELVGEMEELKSTNEQLLNKIEECLHSVGNLLSSISKTKSDNNLPFTEDKFGQRFTEIYEHYKQTVEMNEEVKIKGESYNIVLQSLQDLEYTLKNLEEQLMVVVNLPSLLETHKKGLDKLFKGYNINPLELGVYNKLSNIDDVITRIYDRFSSGSLEESQELLKQVVETLNDISEEAKDINTMEAKNDDLVFKVEYQFKNQQKVDELFQSNLQELHVSFSPIHWEYIINLYEESKEKLANLEKQFRTLKEQNKSNELNFVKVNEVATEILNNLELAQKDINETLSLPQTLNSKLEERRVETKTISNDFEVIIGKHHPLLDKSEPLREMLESIQVGFSDLQTSELQKPFDLLLITRKQENLKTLIDKFTELADEHYEKQTIVEIKISTMRKRLENSSFSSKKAQINENLTAIEYLLKAGMLEEALKEVNSLHELVETIENNNNSDSSESFSDNDESYTGDNQDNNSSID